MNAHLHIHVRCLVLLLLSLMAGSTSVDAQNNIYKLDDRVYPYFEKLNSIPIREMRRFRLATDSLMLVAKRYDDKKAQCIAMQKYVRCEMGSGTVRRTDLEKKLQECADFCQKAGYMQYAYAAYRQVTTQLSVAKEPTLSFYFANKLMELANRLNDDKGRVIALTALGEQYETFGIHSVALDTYRKAYYMSMNHEPADQHALCAMHMAEDFFILGEADSAQHYILISIDKNKEYQKFSSALLAQMFIPHTPQNADVHQRVQDLIDSIATAMPALMSKYEITIYISNLAKAYAKGDYQRMAQLRDSCRYTVTPFEFDMLADAYRHLGMPEKTELMYQRLLQNPQWEEIAVEMMTMEAERDQQRRASDLHLLDIQRSEQALAQLRLQNQLDELRNANDAQERSLLEAQLQERQRRQQMQQQLSAEYQDSVQYAHELTLQYSQLAHRRMSWRVVGIVVLLSMLLLTSFLIASMRRSMRRDEALAEQARQHEALTRSAELRAVQNESLKSLFLQTMNHEIRTPLTAIVSFSQLLNGKEQLSMTAEERKSLVELMRENTQLLIRLIDDVLYISALHSDSYQLKVKTCQARELCEHVVKSLQWRVQEGVKLRMLDGPDIAVTTDPARFQQILINLLTNACKYTEKGEITVDCRTVWEDDTEQVRVVVQDTGAGVPADKAEHLFDRFDKLDSLKPGTGLGLNISYRIAQLLHGSIRYDSTYRKGARFIFQQVRHLATLLILLFGFAFSTAAQQPEYNNQQRVKNRQYDYFRRTVRLARQWDRRFMADTLMQMAVEQNDTGGVCLAKYTKFLFAIYHGDEPLSLKYVDDCYRTSAGTTWDLFGFQGYETLANYYILHKEFDKAAVICDSIIAMAKRIDHTSGYLLGLRAQGKLLSNMGLHKLALDKNLRMAHLLDSLGKGQSLLNSYRNIARSFMLAEMPDSAYQWCLRSLKHDHDKSFLYTYDLLVSLYRPNVYPLDSLHAYYRRLNREMNQYVHPNDRLSYSSTFANYHLYGGSLDSAVYYARHISKGTERYYYLHAAFLAKNQMDSAAHYAALHYHARMNAWNSIMYRVRKDAERQYKKEEQEMQSNLLRLQLLQQQRQLAQLEHEHNQQENIMGEQAREQARLQLEASNTAFQKYQHDLSQQLLEREKEQQKQQLIEDKERLRNNIFIVASLLSWLLLLILSFFAVNNYRSRRAAGRRREHYEQKFHEAQLALERANASDEERTKFLEHISHEIRTPLNAIVGFTELLNGEMATYLSDEERRQMLDDVNRNTFHLNRIVEDLLDLSRMESGRYVPHVMTRSAADIMHQTVEIITGELHPAMPLLIDEASEGADTMLQTDCERIVLVLRHYVGNAIKFAPDAPVTLACHPEVDDEGCACMAFSVSDCGPGIPKGDETKIFEHFKKKSTFTQGAGMGLNVCRLSALHLGGSAYVDATYTEGARFMLRVPIELKVND